MADEYYKDDKLNLYFKDTKDCSLDEAGAEKYKKDKSKATAPGTYVQQVQKDLIALKYLEAKTDKGEDAADGFYGRAAARAITRFQRHAARVYRMDSSGGIKDVAAAAVFKGPADGVCNADTAKEIRAWIDGKFVDPVGRFKTKALAENLGGKLREDAAAAWEAIVKKVHEKGGILIGPYGDCLRTLKPATKDGASNFSVHYCGRAVDICQRLANTNGMIYEGWDLKIDEKDPETDEEKNRRLAAENEVSRCKKIDPLNASFFTEEFEYKKYGKVKKTGKMYFLQKEDVDGKTFWRIHCKTQKQDGSQGKKYSKGDITCYDIGGKKEYKIPAGYYLDLTAEIESSKEFTRIKAHSNWEANSTRTEWWHFQFTVDLQKTFEDELELIGFSEADIGKAGWTTDAQKDNPPG